MSKGLTFGSISSVTVGTTTVTEGTGAGHYTKSVVFNTDGTTTLTITINNFLDYIAQKGAAVYVFYTATLNADAVVGTNSNSVKLTYSNNPEDTTSHNDTPDSKVYV